MTIAIAVKVSEGLVLAADSALVVEGDVSTRDGATQHGILQVYSHATKVTQVLNWPVGTITWGVGQIGSRTIESLVNEYSSTLDTETRESMENIAQGLHAFIDSRYTAAFGTDHPLLGLQVAGFSPGCFFPEQYLLSWPPADGQAVMNARPNRPDGAPDFGANWYGMTDAIVRLYKGFEPQALRALTDAGVDQSVAERISTFEYPVIFEAMPLQDAIDFASWIAQVVIGRFRFVVGPSFVVGPVDIAAITWQSGFRWVQQKMPAVSSDDTVGLF